MLLLVVLVIYHYIIISCTLSHFKSFVVFFSYHAIVYKLPFSFDEGCIFLIIILIKRLSFNNSSDKLLG